MKIAGAFLICAAWAQDSPPVPPAVALQKAEQMQRTFTVVTGQMFNSNPVKGQPYSAEAVNETTQTLADGNKIVRRSSTMVYRDSEGRERREETIATFGALGSLNVNDSPAKVVFISDPVAKVSYTLHPDSKTAERMPAVAMTVSGTTEERVMMVQSSSGAPGGATVGASIELPEPMMVTGRFAGAPAGKVEQLGTETVEGVVADGTRTTTTIPAGEIGNERDINIVSERWFSKELGVLVMSKRSDPRMGETVYKLTNVNRSEPPHSLFEIPSDYTVSEVGPDRKGVAIHKEEQ